MTDPRQDKRIRHGLIPLLVALRMEAKSKAKWKGGKERPDDPFDDEHDDDRR